MHLQLATLKKFAREALVTQTPLVLDEAGIAALQARLTAWFSRIEELNLQWYAAKGPGPVWGGLTRVLCSISTRDLRFNYTHGVGTLGIGTEGGLCLVISHGQPHPVGSEDELLAFLRLCQERAVRIRGQFARRSKVRKLRGAAILARVQELAQAHQFDYHVTEGSMNLNLSLLFDRQHVVEVTIPFAQFDTVLPQLEATLPQLRELVRSGVAAHLRPKAAQLLRHRPWVLHQSLTPPDTDNR